MMSVIMVILAIFLFSCPYFSSVIVASANDPPAVSVSNPSVPDITNWNIVSMSRIELRVSDCAGIYLGFETEYSNPNIPRDFVRVVSRHIPVPISKCRKYNKFSLSEAIEAKYAKKEEQDLLVERSGQSDQFLYIQWQTAKDPRTGRDMLAGDVNIWFMPAEGLPSDSSWPFFKMEKVNVEFLTENINNGKSNNLFSGRKYKVGGFHHLLRADRRDIIKLLEGDR